MGRDGEGRETALAFVLLGHEDYPEATWILYDRGSCSGARTRIGKKLRVNFHSPGSPASAAT